MELKEILWKIWKNYSDPEYQATSDIDNVSEIDKEFIRSWIKESIQNTDHPLPDIDILQMFNIASYCLFGIESYLFYNSQDFYEELKQQAKSLGVSTNILSAIVANMSNLQKYVNQ